MKLWDRCIETTAGLRCIPGVCVVCDRDYWTNREAKYGKLARPIPLRAV